MYYKIKIKKLRKKQYSYQYQRYEFFDYEEKIFDTLKDIKKYIKKLYKNVDIKNDWKVGNKKKRIGSIYIHSYRTKNAIWSQKDYVQIVAVDEKIMLI